MNDQSPVIIDAARTPYGKRNGWLSGVHPVSLLGYAQRGILARTGVDAGQVDQIIGGCVTQAGGQASDVTRQAWLNAGLPVGKGATTIDCQCSSAHQATHLIAAMIASGAIDVGVACGVEVMSRVPLGTNLAGETSFHPPEWNLDIPNQFVGADRIARNRGITREALDAWGLRSQQLAAQAWEQDRLSRQIIPVTLAEGVARPEGTPDVVDRDQGLRATTAEGLASLNPVLPDGLHTAGTSSQISDGATAALLTSEAKARELGLRPRARILAHTLVGAAEPQYQLDGPIQATEHVLKRTGMSIGDIDVFEVNEAFASVVLSWGQVHGVDMDKVNVNGGAIALGHPVGSTGVRLIANVLDEMERRDLQYGMVAICAGGAMASASILERL